MSESAQLVGVTLLGLSCFVIALAVLVWAFRCNPNKPNYRLPRVTLLNWRGKE